MEKWRDELGRWLRLLGADELDILAGAFRRAGNDWPEDLMRGDVWDEDGSHQITRACLLAYAPWRMGEGNGSRLSAEVSDVGRRIHPGGLECSALVEWYDHEPKETVRRELIAAFAGEIARREGE